MNQTYLDTARLLTQIAPTVFAGDAFALKGGTAINLFVRDMPRLSVDLDLVFIDHKLDRTTALNRIITAINAAGGQLTKRGFQIHLPKNNDAGETKVFVRREKFEVKVEVNYVARGTVHPIHSGSLSARAKDVLQADVELPLVSLEDLYGGKLVAAMDRQHPRDLFDVVQPFLHDVRMLKKVMPRGRLLLVGACLHGVYDRSRPAISLFQSHGNLPDSVAPGGNNLDTRILQALPQNHDCVHHDLICTW